MMEAARFGWRDAAARKEKKNCCWVASPAQSEKAPPLGKRATAWSRDSNVRIILRGKSLQYKASDLTCFMVHLLSKAEEEIGTVLVGEGGGADRRCR